MQKSILKLDSWKIEILLDILSILFPEYQHFIIKNNGIIKMRKHWYSIFSHKTTFSELILSEIPYRLSKYRYDNLSKIEYYQTLFNNCIIKNEEHLVTILQVELNKVIPSRFTLIETDKWETIKEILEKQKIIKISNKLITNSNMKKTIGIIHNKNATDISDENKSMLKNFNNGDY